MSVMDVIRRRYSCRKFAGRPVEEEKLRQILEAGRLAPTAANNQQNRHVLVTDRAFVTEMVTACNGQKWIETAPAILVECSVGDRTMPCGHSARCTDSAIALSFMYLTAVDLGLQGCWIGNFDPSRVRQALSLPENWEVFDVMPIGYPGDDGHPREKKPLEELAVIR